MAEWARFYRYEDTGDVTALHARFISYKYPRHSHDYFVIGLVERGVQAYTYRGVRHTTPAGSLFFVNPDEVHTGEAANAEGYVYRTLCLSQSFVAKLTHEIGSKAPCLYLRESDLTEPDLANAIRCFHKSIARGDPKIESDLLLYEAASLLFGRHGDAPRKLSSPRCEIGAVVKAREYIEDNFDKDVSLAHLAEVCSLSPFFLARTFRKGTGLPPHAYLDGVRLRHARQLLDKGEPIASTAISVGYADQSHLTKRFKRLYGITPGQYRNPGSGGSACVLKQQAILL